MYLSQLKHIKAFIFDVDGVLTNGSVFVTEEGHHLRHFNIKDGYALQLAVKKGYSVCIISGGKSEGVKKRLQDLGIQDIFLGVARKLDVFRQYLDDYGLKSEGVIYTGDDIPDYEIMKETGVAACPADAAPEIQALCHYISPYKGGEGVARDIIEKVMKVQNKWLDDQQGFVW